MLRDKENGQRRKKKQQSIEVDMQLSASLTLNVWLEANMLRDKENGQRRKKKQQKTEVDMQLSASLTLNVEFGWRLTC